MKRFAVLVATAAALGAGAVALLTGGIATARSASATATLPTIDIAMDGKSIAVSGTLQSGAVDIRSTVTKAKEAEPTLVRLNPGVTSEQFLAFMKSNAAQDPNEVRQIGSIALDARAPRGTSDVQTTLQPGNYIALDTDRERPPFPFTQFTVAAASSPATLPKARDHVEAIDFAFRSPRVLHDGQLVRASNHGWVVHMVVGIGVRSAAAGRKVERLLRAGKERQTHRFETRTFFSLMGPVSHGGLQQLVLHARPGYYVLACFMDTQDGREHVRLGMTRLIRVVK